MNRKKSFLIGVTFLTVILSFLMLAPFFSYLLTGILLAFVLTPLQKRMEHFFSGEIAAGLTVSIAILTLLVPFIMIAGFVGNDAASLIDDVKTSNLTQVDRVEEQVQIYSSQELDLKQSIRTNIKGLSSRLVGGASAALGFAADVFIGVSLMIFLLYYSLKDGRDFVEWTKDFDLMPDEVQEDLYDRTAKTTWHVVKGHVLIAIAQGLVAGVGLWVTGIPNFAFWTVVMVLLGFIPMIGTALVWVPASIYLFMLGQINSALILLAFGIVVVGAIDNFLRPLAVDGSSDLHPFFVISGVIGGVGIFGAVGLFLGPVIFGVLKALLDIFRKEYQEL